MAFRPLNMHDGGVVERRLRPIYDWLDNGNNKKALQEAEKVLKKSPSLQSARALKALALFRLGKFAEAYSVLDVLAEEKPSDDTTLQAMSISYRESQQYEKICSLYEAAVKAEPKNEELHSHLFMAYMRVGDYQAQQRTAMALYKLTPKNPYYFWAVMSIVLQAKSSDDKAKKNILLTLAQRMVDNFISEKRIEAEQEARLYIMILELQEKWSDILKFLESPLYSSLIPGSTSQNSMQYLIKMGEWKRLNLLCKDLLLDNPDRWDYYMTYFDSVFHLIKEGPYEGETVDDTAEKCHEFVCQLVESMSNGRVLRGPYLARLELWKRLAKDGDPTALLGSGVALCIEYLRVFAHKLCAIPDLRPYLEMLTQSEREENSRGFLTCLGFDENSEPDNMDDIQRQISCVAAWRITAAPLPPAGDLALAATLRRRYAACLRSDLHSSTVTEFCATDGYAMLAAHHYFYAAIKTDSCKPLIDAICLLELVLHKSPANFHAKLLLIVLYHLYGVSLAADSIYHRLEVKHIQLISLGWLHAAALPGGGALSRALALLSETCATHKHHSNESVEHLTYAYRYGTFDKLVELYAWSRRLKGCGFSARAGRERSALAWVLSGAGQPAPAPLPAGRDSFSDNRDLNIIVNYDPPQTRDPDLKSKSFELDIAYLRLKDGIVSAVTLCTELGDNRAVEEKETQYEELRICVDAFSGAMEKCREKYKDRIRISISFPFQPRIIAFVNSPVPYRELYCCMFSLVAELSYNNTSTLHCICNETSELISGSVDKVRTEFDSKNWPRDRLEGLTNYLEFIGIAAYLLGVCSELVTPPKSRKSKKKMTQSPDELRTSQLLNQLADALLNSMTFLEQTFDALPVHKFETTIEDDLKNMNIDMKFISPIENKLKSGHEDMVNDVKSILRKISKYLKGIMQNL